MPALAMLCLCITAFIPVLTSDPVVAGGVVRILTILSGALLEARPHTVVRYEDLVTQPRDALGRVLENLEADWHERCLAFDTLDTTVKTGSVWQVREPLHARSIGRWKNYRTHFESVFGDRLEA